MSLGQFAQLRAALKPIRALCDGTAHVAQAGFEAETRGRLIDSLL